MIISSFVSRLPVLNVCFAISFCVSAFAERPGGKPGGGGGGGRGGGNDPPFNAAVVAGSESGIFLLESGGATQRLTRPKGQQADIRAIWSPDGSQIAFMRHPDQRFVYKDIYTISPDGSNQTLIYSFDSLSAPIPDGHFGGFEWTPDGSRLLYEANASEIWALTLGGDLELVFDSLSIANDGSEWWLGNDFTLSPDMDPAAGYQGALTFSAYDSSIPFFELYEIFTLAIEIDESGAMTVGTLTNLTNTPNRSERLPAWHPLGTQLLFETIDFDFSTGAEDRAVVIRDLLTGDERTLIPEPLKTLHYDWSPFGNYVAYTSYFFNNGIPSGDIWYQSPWEPVSPSIHIAGDQYYTQPDWNPNWVDDITLP